MSIRCVSGGGDVTEWRDKRGKIMSIRCVNGGGDATEWRDNRGKIMSVSDVLVEVGT